MASKTADAAQLLSFLGAIGCIIMSIPPLLIGAAGYSAGRVKSQGGFQLKIAKIIISHSLIGGTVYILNDNLRELIVIFRFTKHLSILLKYLPVTYKSLAVAICVKFM